MGSGKSSGSQQAVVTQEQKDALRAQTDALTGTFLPAYQKTIGQAQDVYGRTIGGATSAANTASDVAGRTGAVSEIAGTGGVLTGMTGLASLFGQYSLYLGYGILVSDNAVKLSNLLLFINARFVIVIVFVFHVAIILPCIVIVN